MLVDAAEATMSITKLHTIDDLWAMGSDAPFELIEGELREVPPSFGYSSLIGGNIFGPLHTHVRKLRLGFITGEAGGYVLSRNPDTLVAPEVGFVAHDRLPNGLNPDEYVPMAPDLAVEVVSHSDRYSDVTRKVQRYLQAGTRLVWVVRTDLKSVVVFAQDREPQEIGIDDALDGEDVIPDFRLPLTEIFD
jgi:Uma2 family endonuclease